MSSFGAKNGYNNYFFVPLHQIKVQTLLMPPRLVRSGRTESSELFALCLLDRTLANLRGVLLDGRHPFFLYFRWR